MTRKRYQKLRRPKKKSFHPESKSVSCHPPDDGSPNADNKAVLNHAPGHSGTKRSHQSIGSPGPFKLWMLILTTILLFQTVTAPDMPNPSPNSSRIRRDAAKFSDLVGNLESLARISSGLSLEIGLMDSTIAPDAVISDLLRMGSVKPGDIIGLKSEAIESALKSLEDLSINAADEVINAENRFVILEEMRGIASTFKDLKTIPGLEDYKASLALVDGLGSLESGIKTFCDSADAVLTNLKILKKTKDASLAVGSMLAIFSHLKNIEASAKTFGPTIEQLSNAKKVREDSKFLKLLIKEDNLRSGLLVVPKFNNAAVEILLKNLNNLFNVSKSVNASRTSFVSIQELIKSRSPSFHHQFQVAPGLPSGQSDLGQLSSSIRTPWISSRISNGSLVSEKLGKAFFLFSSLIAELKNVESFWSNLKDKSNRDVVDVIVTACLQLADVSAVSQGLSEAVEQLKTCEGTIFHPRAFKTELSDLQNATDSLNSAIGGVSDFAYMNRFKDLGNVKSHFNTKDLPTDEEKEKLANKTLNILQTDKGIQKLEQDVQKISDDLQRLLDFISNKKLTKNIQSQLDKNVLEYYKRDVLSQEYRGFYTRLAGIRTKGTPVKSAIQVLQNARKFSMPPGFKVTFESIVKSGKELINAQTEADEFKKVNIREATALKGSFSGSSDVSYKLGMGVLGLSAIAKASGAKEKLKPLMDGSLEKAPNRGLTKDQNNAMKALKQLPDVFDSIDKYLTVANGLNVYRKKRSADFQSVQKIFEEAVQVKGVDIDMKSLREALESLKSSSPKNYDQAVTSMAILEKLDLNFAKFDIPGAGPSLAALDDFFNKYAVLISQSPPSSPSNRNGSAALVAPKAKTSDEKEEESSNGWILITLVCVLIFCGVCASLVSVFCYCRNKRKVKYDVIPDDSHSSNIEGDGEESKAGVKKEGNEGKKKEDGGKEDKDGAKDGGKGPKDGDKDGAKEGAKEGDQVNKDGAKGTKNGDKDKKTAEGQQGENKIVPENGPAKQNLDVALGMIIAVVDALVWRLNCMKTPIEWCNELLTGATKAADTMMTQEEVMGNCDERRYSKFACKKLSMAEILGFENDKFINCNVFEFGGRRYLMAQAPLDGTETEVVRGETIRKRDTRAKHYAAIEFNNVGICIQLCEEYEKAGNGQLKRKSSKYHPTKKNEVEVYGRYSVKCLDVLKKLEGFPVELECFTLYKLEYTNLVTKQTKTVDILQYTGWPDQSVPESAETCLQIINFFNNYKSNMLVHCSAGIGRTGTLVGVMYGIETCQTQKIQPTDIISNLRTCRHGAIQDAQQVIYMLLCITTAIMRKAGIEFLKEYEILKWCHEHPLVYYGFEDAKKDKVEWEAKNKDRPDEELTEAEKKKKVAVFERFERKLADLAKSNDEMKAHIEDLERQNAEKLKKKKTVEEKVENKEKKESEQKKILKVEQPIPKEKSNKLPTSKTGEPQKKKASEQKKPSASKIEPPKPSGAVQKQNKKTSKEGQKAPKPSASKMGQPKPSGAVPKKNKKASREPKK